MYATKHISEDIPKIWDEEKIFGCLTFEYFKSLNYVIKY